MEWEREVRDFLLSPQGCKSFHSDLPRVRWHNLVCVEYLSMMKSMVIGFCFLRVDATLSDGVGFDNTCTVSGKGNGSRFIPRPYWWVCKTLRISPLVVELSVVVVSVRLNPMGSQLLIPVLWNLCSESVVAKNVETQLRTPKLAVRVQLPLRWNTYLFFNTDVVNFVWKTDAAETESIVLLIFFLWGCLNLRWMRGGGMGQKVLIWASWNRIFFQPVFQPNQ